MNIRALYVFEPTTFTTDTPIVSITGEKFAAGTAVLKPGVYRVSGDGSLTATGGKHETVSPVIEGTKNPWPDPPLAMKNLVGGADPGKTITTFLGGAGATTAV